LKNKIGVILGEKGVISNLFQMTQIDIYQLEDDWKVIRTHVLHLQTSTTLALRQSLKELVNQLANCKILVGTTIVGIPYHFLNKEGFVLCEAKLLNRKLLDQIFVDYCVEKVAVPDKIVEKVPIYPQPVDNDGNFYLDFIKVQRYHSGISSKKALLPFLSHELFQTLTISCSHVMPWLEYTILERGLEMSFKREDGKYIVVITHNLCSGV
jgi:hypothetical protein